jgi:hypothetical protein
LQTWSIMDGPGFQHAVADAASPRGASRADRRDAARPAGRDAVSQGSPLAGGDQAFFGAAFGHDFSKVRVHADRGAAASAAEARAHAYTVGDHVYFADGRYAPATAAGRQLLAHELAHVVQQGRGGGPGQADDARAQLDADRAGRSAAGGGPATVAEARPVGMARQPADETPAATPADPAAQAPGDAQADAPAPADAQASADAQAPADAGTRIEEALIRRLTGALVPGDVAGPVVIEVIRGMVHQLTAEHAGSKLWARLLTITPKGVAQVAIGYEAGALEGLASPIGDLFGLVVFEEQVEAMARQVLASILAGQGDLSAAAQALAKEASALAGQIADEFAKFKARPAKETIADLLELPDALAGVAVHKAYDFGVQAGKDIAAALEAPWKAEEEQKPAPSFLSMPATWTQSKYEELKGRLLSTPWLKVGNKIGYAVGWVAIQVVLLFFTEGIGNAIEKVGAVIGRVGEFLGGLSKVIGQGAAKVAEFVGEIGKAVTVAEEAIAGVLKKLLKPLEPLLRPIRTFLKDLEGFLRKLVGIPEKEIVQAADVAAAKAGRTLGHDAPPAPPKPPEHVAPPTAHKPPEHVTPPAGPKPPEHTAPPTHKPPEHVTSPPEQKPPEPRPAEPKPRKRAKPAEPKPPEHEPAEPKPRKRARPEEPEPLTPAQASKLAAVDRERQIITKLENQRVAATNELDELLAKPKRDPGDATEIMELQKELKQLNSRLDDAQGRLQRAEADLARSMRTPFQEFRSAVDADLAGRKVTREVGPLKVPSRTPRPTHKDHIVSVREMWDMDGFGELGVHDRVEVANMSENLINMDGVANASKGQQPWRAWRQASNFYGQDTIDTMRRLDSEVRPRIAAEIKRRLALRPAGLP